MSRAANGPSVCQSCTRFPRVRMQRSKVQGTYLVLAWVASECKAEVNKSGCTLFETDTMCLSFLDLRGETCECRRKSSKRPAQTKLRCFVSWERLRQITIPSRTGWRVHTSALPTLPYLAFTRAKVRNASSIIRYPMGVAWAS